MRYSNFGQMVSADFPIAFWLVAMREVSLVARQAFLTEISAAYGQRECFSIPYDPIRRREKQMKGLRSVLVYFTPILRRARLPAVARSAVALALILGCHFDSPERRRGIELIEDLERRIEGGAKEVPVQDLTGSGVELICVLPPYAWQANVQPIMSNEAVEILRQAQRNGELQNDAFWGLLAIDNSRAGKYRLYLVGRKERGFLSDWDNAEPKEKCFVGERAVLAVDASRRISIRQTEK